jgi:hypothetical protein
MKITGEERDLLLRGLFELTITHVEDESLRNHAKRLAKKLGGKPNAIFFGAVPGHGHH